MKITSKRRERAQVIREEAEAEAAYQARLEDANWAEKQHELIKKLVERTAKGIDPCAVLGPDGVYRIARSGEEAFFIQLGTTSYPFN